MNSSAKEFWIGFGLALLWVIVVQAFLYVVLLSVQGDDPYAGIGPLVLLLQVGWTQVLYLPIFAVYQHMVGKRPTRAKGIWLVSGILFLLTSFCNAALAFS